MSDDPIATAQKRTYNETVGRLGFFCQVCGSEVRNANGLVYFESTETVQSLNVCHECLPEWFE